MGRSQQKERKKWRKRKRRPVRGGGVVHRREDRGDGGRKRGLVQWRGGRGGVEGG